MRLPRVAVTVGDPAGIGPEIAARAAADEGVREVCEPVLYAPPDARRFEPGRLDAGAGRAAYDVIVRAVEAARQGEVDAIATAPVSKEAFHLAGLPWKGHTDLLAHLTGAPFVAMMFDSPALKVVLATVHVALADVPRQLTRRPGARTIRLTARELPRFGVRAPRLAMAGAQPARGRARPDGHRGRRGDPAGRRGLPGRRRRCIRARFPPTPSSCGRIAASSTRSWPATMTRA